LHVARYKGPSTRVFLNAYRDDDCLQMRVSICEPCLDLLLEPWAARAYVKVSERDWDPVEEGQDLRGLWRPQGERSGPRNGGGR
jgi:hypothetical protein